MDPLTPGVEDPTAPDVRALLDIHFDLMRSLTPEEGCHVIDPAKFQDEQATLMGIRKDGLLLGVGALKKIETGHGELKSMHTAASARGQGVARALLCVLIAMAKQRDMHRLSLETGTAPGFAAARALYISHGFVECPPFAQYNVYPLSVYMTKTLSSAEPIDLPSTG